MKSSIHTLIFCSMALVITSVVQSASIKEKVLTSCFLTGCPLNSKCKFTLQGPKCVFPTQPRLILGNTCAAIRCEKGTICIETKNGPKCQGSGIILTCDEVMCASGDVCITTLSGPECVARLGSRCGSILCPEGTECIETKQGPKCEGSAAITTCETVKCKRGESCIETASGPECAPLPGSTCGSILCPKGSNCIVTSNGPTCRPDCVCSDIFAPVCCLLPNGGIATTQNACLCNTCDKKALVVSDRACPKEE